MTLPGHRISKTLAGLAATLAVTLFFFTIGRGLANRASVGFALVLVILAVAAVSGFMESAVVGVAATLEYGLFLPPTGSFRVVGAENWVALGSFLITAGVASWLSASGRDRAVQAERKRLKERSEVLTELQKGERALRESEERFKAFLDNSPALIFIKNTEGRYLLVNRQFEKVFRLAPGQISGKTDAEVFPPGQATAFRSNDLKVLDAGVPLEFEEVALQDDGPHTSIVYKFPLRDTAGKIYAVCGIATDITERKRAEQALRTQALVLENMGEGVNVSDESGVILFANAALETMFGYERGRLLGKHVSVLNDCPPEENARRVSQVIRELNAKGFWSGEFKNRKRDGTSFTTRTRISALESLGRKYWISLQEDVTERRRAEERLRQSEEGFRLLVEGVKDYAIFGLDTEGRVLSWNAGAEHIKGYRVEEIIGSHFSVFYLPEDVESGKPERHLRTAAAEGRLEGEGWLQRKNGSRFWANVVITALYDDAGKLRGFAKLTRDVTEHKRLEEQLRQSQKIEAIGRLAGGIAHDFNNLLTIIGGYGQLLLDRPGLADTVREHIQEIKQAGDRASALTRQLLAFSRKQVLAPQVLDLGSVVAGLEKMLRRLIGEDIELITIVDKELGRVKADPSQIEQVIINLAVNARDAMPTGGRLTIETANVDLDEAFARAHEPTSPGAYVMVAVSDTGIGIDADTQAHIFEPFFTTKPKGKGTGLGLAMVYGTVKQSGGYIWVESELGKGATFKVYLPRVEESPPPVEATKVQAKVPTGSEIVLVVEDEDSVRSLVRGILKTNGYVVLEAGQAEEALSICQQHKGPIHLLLTDVVMPGMGGVELAQRLTSIRPQTKVLFMSGYTDDAIARHGLPNAGTALLAKPFTPESLTRRVRELLDGSGEKKNGPG